jgi:hypothetical protein
MDRRGLTTGVLVSLPFTLSVVMLSLASVPALSGLVVVVGVAAARSRA